MTRTPCGMKKANRAEYNSWINMRRRCQDQSNPKFPDYGGRGITVCQRWESFENFLNDMGPKPSPEMSLGRIDNNQGYSPENCRWETPQQQAANRRFCHYVMLDGQKLTIAEASRLLGIPDVTIRTRLLKRNLGWETALMPGTLDLPQSRQIHFRGQTDSIIGWAKKLGLQKSTLRERLVSGMPLERALTPGRLRPVPKPSPSLSA